jgi:hypothetical protein
VRERLPDGESLAERAEQQEHEAEGLLERIGSADAADPEFDQLVKTLTSALRKHVAFEDTVLGQVRERVGEAAREEAGRRFKAARSAYSASIAATGKAG